MHIPKFTIDTLAVRYPCFDKELHSFDNNKTKAYKFVKNFEKMNIRRMSESVQGQYDATCCRFHNLRKDFKYMHRFEYAQYIEWVGTGIKTTPQNIFRITDMIKNSTAYPSTMFLHVEFAWNSQDIADLFARYFQIVYVNNFLVENAYGNVFDEGPDDLCVSSLIHFQEVDVRILWWIWT
jgi:hypothetical protein